MLKQRVVTAAIGLVVVFLALVWSPLSWKALVYAGCLLAVSEFVGMTAQRWYGLSAWCSYALVTWVIWAPQGLTLLSLQVALAVALVLPVLLRNRTTLAQTASLFVGTLYIGWGGLSISTLRNIGPGWAWLLLFLVSIWATDTVAYFAGSWLRGPKLWPDISPKKTVSGAVAGLFGAAVAAMVVGITMIHNYPLFLFAWIGLVVSVLGQIGDLVESAYKRSAGVKDSGNLLPGHGGLLDRIDSMLFAAPFAVYLTTHAHWIG